MFYKQDIETKLRNITILKTNQSEVSSIVQSYNLLLGRKTLFKLALGIRKFSNIQLIVNATYLI